MNRVPDAAAVVLIDATAVPRDRGGVGRYVDGLVSQLHEPFHLACQAHDAEYFRSIAPAAIVHPQSAGIAGTARRLIWEQTGLPRLARKLGIRVVHSPHYTLPLGWRGGRVVTFHDATFFSDPEVHTRLKRTFFRAWIRLSARIADAILVPSRSAGEELAAASRRPVTRFTVAHHGVDPAVFHPPASDDVERFSHEHDLGSGWIAFLGTLEPRKNLPALVDAYADVASTWDDSADLPVLALAGGRGWEDRLDTAVSAVREPGRVERLGFLPLDDLSTFLGGSTLVAYPSLGEGFGLPVLEGMASGAPVLTTRALALPEVGGDAVEYTAPDARSIAAALRGLLADATRRVALATAGLERSRLFTWRASAEIHERVYAEVAGGAPAGSAS